MTKAFPLLMTVPQTAAYLGRPVEWTRARVRQGIIPARKDEGGRYLVSRPELDRWLDGADNVPAEHFALGMPSAKGSL